MSELDSSVMWVIVAMLSAAIVYLIWDEMQPQTPAVRRAPMMTTMPPRTTYSPLPPTTTFRPVPTWRTQGTKDLAYTSTAADPQKYGFPPVTWRMGVDADEPWAGSENARNLDAGRNLQFQNALISYDFPNAGHQQHITSLGSTKDAGLQENGIFSRSGREDTFSDVSMWSSRDVAL